ncbi:MAG: hypothetical protein NTY02_19805 [Acidobacteria bacterium]|nr:hypothetical protein [Acidobacteriota bacterium]
MSTRPVWSGFALGVALLVVPATLPAQSQATGGKWESSRSGNGIRQLSYSATVALLGKPTPITLTFSCDPVQGKIEHGVIGFDLNLGNIAALAPFSFEDFEGPDAAALGKNMMRVTIARAGRPVVSVALSPNGGTPSENNFTFGIAERSDVAGSTERTILQALAEGADTFQLIITDTRSPKLRLELTVPVAGEQAAFKSLLAGLK